MAGRKSPTRDIRIGTPVSAAPEDVYRALTSARELCAWWLERAETAARNMGRFRMVWSPGGRRARSEATGVFVDLEPASKVAWIIDPDSRPSGWPALVSFFIEARRRGCEVTVVHAGFSGAPSRRRVHDSARVGWEDCLAKLKLYLEKGKTRKAERLRLSRPGNSAGRGK